MKKRYVLNSAVFPAGNDGIFEYKVVTLDDIREWLSMGGYTSTIGYESTAEFLSEKTGMQFEVNIRPVHFEEGDEAAVIRLTSRCARGMKGKFVPEEDDFEFGILRRIPQRYVIPKENEAMQDCARIQVLAKRIQQELEKMEEICRM